MAKMSENLTQAIEQFYKMAQTFSTNTDLPDTIKQMYGKAITQDVAQFLNTKAVSSIPVSINFDRAAHPAAQFVIDAMGADSAIVNDALKKLLDQKYGAKVGQLIALRDKSTPAFAFNLFTVE